MNPLTVTRSIRIQASVDRVWSSLATGDGLARWLADDVEVDVVPGGAGRAVELDEAARRIVVTEVLDGQRLGFTWWRETEPDDASQVVISIDGGNGDATTVTVVETLAPAARRAAGAIGACSDSIATARVDQLIVVDLAWRSRLEVLAGAFVAVAAGA